MWDASTPPALLETMCDKKPYTPLCSRPAKVPDDLVVPLHLGCNCRCLNAYVFATAKSYRADDCVTLHGLTACCQIDSYRKRNFWHFPGCLRRLFLLPQKGPASSLVARLGRDAAFNWLVCESSKELFWSYVRRQYVYLLRTCFDATLDVNSHTTPKRLPKPLGNFSAGGQMLTQGWSVHSCSGSFVATNFLVSIC